MARIEQSPVFNGKLGFQSEFEFSWRDDPNVVNYRHIVVNAIQTHLAQKAYEDFRMTIPQLALSMENHIFMEAISQEDYMDQDKLIDRVRNLIIEKWYKAKSDQQKSNHNTKFLAMYTSASTVRATESDIGTSFNSSLHVYASTNDTGSHVGYPDNLNQPYLTGVTASVAKAGYPGSRKRSFSATLQPSEQLQPNICSFREEFSFDDPVHNCGPTFSGSEASYESHCDKPRYISEGDMNLFMPSNQNSPPLQTQSVVGDIPKLDASTFYNDVNTQQPLLEHSQLEEQLVQPNVLYADRCLGNQESLDRVSDLNKNSYAVQDVTAGPIPLSSYHCFSQHSFNDEQRHSVDKLLSCYILYRKNRFENKMPFVGFWHSQNCGGGMCSCEKNRMMLSHFDNCVSSDCGTCAPAVRMHGNNFGNMVNSETSKDLPIPTKRKKLSSSVKCGSSADVSGLSVDSTGLCGLLNVESGSPVMVISENSEASMEMAISHANDPSRIGHVGVVNVDLTTLVDDISGDIQENDKKPASLCDLNDMGADSFCELVSDSGPSLRDDEKVAVDEEGLTRNDSEVIEPKEEGSLCSITSLAEIKSEKQKVDGISLIDFFTAEEIKQHIFGLRQKADQVIAEEIMGNTDTCSVSENLCQLCAVERLSFPPMPIYCSACGARVKNYLSYYSTKDDRAQFCFCTQCYHRCRGAKNITFYGFSVSKNNLELRKNNLVTDESWVQCDKCERWQHQICALFNDKRDLGGKVEYICPTCHLEDLGTGERATIPLPRTTLDASHLPQTLLSDHLEERLFRRLSQEREERAKAAGKNPEEVPQPDDLIVRVVSSVDKRLKVKQQFLDIFPEKNYPAEFPYRSKVVLLFQRIEGVDVCLFAMYVQEFGSECSLPNQRCVYISYLDSVKYFRPEMKTLKGEALRTFVYHEILVGYLDYCKKRGFATCYIWACPPVKGEDYILYCHPETQKTPRPDKLRQWYQNMLKKATEEKIVVNFSNLYEKFFVPNGESNAKVTAARLPYFDGDYWSGVAESMIKKIESESGGDPEKQIKKMTRRSLKAMGHTNPSAREAKDILLMQALAQSISSAKEDFIIVYLQSVCSHCHEVILSGKRWFCNQCKNYQLCERCHEKELCSGQGETHISSSGQKHALCQEIVNDVPVDTEDNDAIMNNCFLENRHAFLNFCQGNHYQFDSLRRAKHSSMMILYHLHNPNEPSIEATCSLCLKYIGTDPKWTCDMCPDFNVCGTCYQRSNAACHSHTLFRHPPVTAVTAMQSRVGEMVRELLNSLVHASRCQIGNHCSYPKCTLIRRLFSHAHTCQIRSSGGCCHCRKTWFVLTLHSRRCKDSNCSVPRCIDVRKYLSSLETKSNTGPRRVIPDASVKPVL